MTFKIRLSEAGVHLFDRMSGLNVLLDEVPVPTGRASRDAAQAALDVTTSTLRTAPR